MGRALTIDRHNSRARLVNVELTAPEIIKLLKAKPSD